MTVQKYLQFYNTVGANSSNIVSITTQDDNQIRTVTGIWCNDETKLVQTVLQLQGKNIVAFDDFFNSLLKAPLQCNVAFPAGVNIFLGLINGTAGAITNAGIVIRYEVPQ